jgi:subtilisin family serine protease
MSLFRLSTCAAACLLLLACGGGGGDAASGSGTATGGGAVPGPTPSPTPTPVSVADEVLVKLFNAADLPAVLAANGLVQVEQFGRRPIYRLRGAPGSQVEALAERLRADVRVQYAEPNLVHETPNGQRGEAWAIGGDAGVYAAQWNTRALRLQEAHTLSLGTGVTVAVLDTGVEASHPALAGRLVPGFDFVDFDTTPNEEGRVGDAGYGHGTHVASLVAQVAPGARIMPLRVLNAQGVGNTWVLAEALLYAVDPDGNPATADGAQVINLSLGTTRRSDVLEDIIEAITCDDDDDDDDADDNTRCAAGGGAVVVSAAGNAGNSTPYYPAAEREDGTLAVAASTEAGALAGFSNRGDWVQVAAPGERIYGAVPGGRWAVWSGTSMAAPMAAGAAALLRARFPAWGPDAVADRLSGSARTLCGNTPLRQIDAMAALSGTSGPALACP